MSKGALRVIANGGSDGRDGLARIQFLLRQDHAPVSKVVERRPADTLGEPLREGRTRHADLRRQHGQREFQDF